MTHTYQRTQRSELDRRYSARTLGYTRLNHGRRRARRTHLFDEVFWRRTDDPKCHRGILVPFLERSTDFLPPFPRGCLDRRDRLHPFGHMGNTS